MKTYTQEQQNNFLIDMKNLIYKIRNNRAITGEEHPKHAEIWQEIDNLYNRLDYKHQEEFNNFVQ